MPTEPEPDSRRAVAPVVAGSPPDAEVEVVAPAAVDLGAAPSSGAQPRTGVAGLVGHYALLVALAALVLVPIILTFFQALSPPIPYLDAGKPWHPVSVAWKDRTWFDGGAVSVLLRSLVLLVGLAWLQAKVVGVRLVDHRALARPRHVVPVVSGFVALAGLSGPVIGAMADGSDAAAAWWLAAVVVVAATQVPGFVRVGRPGWRVALYAGAAAVALVAVVVVAAGAAVWTDAWTDGRLGPALTRSLVMSVLIVVCQVATSVFAAYAFAFLRFPFKGLVFAFFMATLLLPMEVTLLGNVQTIRTLGWIDSYQGLVLPLAASAFGTFLIRQGFRGIPPEIRDAARLDGYSHLSFMWRFAVPLTRPVIGAFTVVAGLVAWNQYLWPQAIIDDQRQETAQVALRTMSTTDLANANVGIAAALIVSLPIVALLVAFQRHIVRGLTAGAVK